MCTAVVIHLMYTLVGTVGRDCWPVAGGVVCWFLQSVHKERWRIPLDVVAASGYKDSRRL